MKIEQVTILEQAEKLLADGTYLEAYEAVRPLIEDGGAKPKALHLACLALARSGATSFARSLLEEYRLKMGEIPEFVTLEGRIYKDLARNYQARGDIDSSIAYQITARDAYFKAFERDLSTYSGINCATLTLLTGEFDRSQELARKVIELSNGEDSRSYWYFATLIEAYLILGEVATAKQYIQQAIALPDFSVSSRVTTHKQLSDICDYLQIDKSLIKPLHPPLTLHYTGPLIHGVGSTQGLFPKDVREIERLVDIFLDENDIAFAYGSLACGGDLIIANALLKRKVKVHALLPFAREQFVKSSVERGGQYWVELFDKVYEQCTRVDCVSVETTENEELLYKLTSSLAMGLANLKGRELNSLALQLVIWNTNRAKNGFGSHYDWCVWDALPEKQLRHVIEYSPNVGDCPATCVSETNQALDSQNASTPPENSLEIKRLLRAMIFADVKGFSKLKESQLPFFMNQWTKKLRGLKEEYVDSICLLNTWGDAVFAVFDNVVDAAKFAITLSKIFDDQDEPKMGIRVSAHAGPVYQVHDPIIDNFNYYGRPVNQTARMEPCTPLGIVYVTEEFSSYLALRTDEFTCSYAGEHVLPKGFGTLRMYCLNG